MNNYKICRVCGEKKPLSAFYIRKDTGKYRNDCIDCNNKHSYKYRLAHLEEDESIVEDIEKNI